ncbi:hypothetical protein C0W59_22090 [Photobacterium kishitanii]|nr:hypothetical protein C0W59_22090 [Photobacterium kishitanii]
MNLKTYNKLIISKSEFHQRNFDKTIKRALAKYGYVSLEGIVRSQYYFPYNNKSFYPIKRTWEELLYYKK